MESVANGNNNTLLTVACLSGYAASAALLLKHGADVKGGAGKLSPLSAVMHAASGRSGCTVACSGDELVTLAKELLAKGAEVLPDGLSLLFMSDKEAAVQMLAFLLDTVLPTIPLVGLKETLGETTAVGLALAFTNTKGILELLLAKKAPLPNGAMAKAKAVHYAPLLAAGADVNAVDQYGRSAIFSASGSGDVSALEVLLSAGGDVNVQDKDRRTALHFAASSGKLQAVLALLKAGAAIDTKDKEGRTPLVSAVGNERFDTITALVEAGASKEGADEAATSDELSAALRGAAELAAWRANAEAAQAAAAEAAAAEAAKPENRLKAAIDAAAATENDVSSLKALLDQGLDPNTVLPSVEPYTSWPGIDMPVLAAAVCAQMNNATHGGLHAVRLLLERGAKPNLTFEFGDDQATVRRLLLPTFHAASHQRADSPPKQALSILPLVSNWWVYDIKGDPWLLVDSLLTRGADPAVKLSDGAFSVLRCRPAASDTSAVPPRAHPPEHVRRDDAAQ